MSDPHIPCPACGLMRCDDQGVCDGILMSRKRAEERVAMTDHGEGQVGVIMALAKEMAHSRAAYLESGTVSDFKIYESDLEELESSVRATLSQLATSEAARMEQARLLRMARDYVCMIAADDRHSQWENASRLYLSIDAALAGRAG